MSNRKGLLALSPLFVFVTIYLVASIIAQDFYKVPISVAFVIASIYAVAISYKNGLRQSVDIFSKGASKSNIMLMLWIFMGSVDATVDLMLSLLPDNMLLPGLFLATCFISLSIGTSVGTIVALVPIAAGLAQSTGSPAALLTAVVVGGAFFGDNLSFISDTTIAATSSQGCSMSDKFKVNFFITTPAAIIILGVYTFMGMHMNTTSTPHPVDIMRVIPYIAVLATAIAGLNVMLVLTIGILLTGIIGMLSGAMGVFDWFHAMGEGIMGMGLYHRQNYPPHPRQARSRRHHSVACSHYRCLYRQQYRGHHLNRRHSQKNLTAVCTRQPQGGKHSRHKLVRNAMSHTLRGTAAHGFRTLQTQPSTNHTLSVLPLRPGCMRAVHHSIPTAKTLQLSNTTTTLHPSTLYYNYGRHQTKLLPTPTLRSLQRV